jgi:hypothetical protein
MIAQRSPLVRSQAKPAPTPPADLVEVFEDVPQGEEEWFALRRSLPTASRFADVLAQGEGKMRQRYLYQLAAEALSGETMWTYSNPAMEEGKAMEPHAAEWYERAHLVDLVRVGFVRRTVRRPLGSSFIVGASPDGLVGDDGCVEFKKERPDLLIERAEKGAKGFPMEHRAQCQGVMWVTDRKWCDLVVYHAAMPFKLRFQIERDDVYIARLADAVEVFCYDLKNLIERNKARA